MPLELYGWCARITRDGLINSQKCWFQATPLRESVIWKICVTVPRGFSVLLTTSTQGWKRNKELYF